MLGKVGTMAMGTWWHSTESGPWGKHGHAHNPGACLSFYTKGFISHPPPTLSSLRAEAYIFYYFHSFIV